MRAQAIFVENLPVIGRVPMVFYLPPSQNRHDMQILIEKHGGMVSDFHECFTYQVAPILEDVEKIQYFWGDVFLGHWIVDSIKQGRLLDCQDYLAFVNKEKGSKRVDFIAERVKYTITEGIKIFEIALANQSSEHAARGSAFWLTIQRLGSVPNRPGESMRNFWKTISNRGLEDYLSRAVADESRFCHAFKQIPQVKTAVVQSQGPQHSAEVRLFEAASIPMDDRRYKVDQSKNLRSVSKSKAADELATHNQLFQRMEKIRPSRVGTKAKNGQTEENEEMMVSTANQEMQQQQPDELEQLMVSKQGIVVKEKGGSGQPIELHSGQEAYFALLAQDMLAIAKHFNVGVHEVHKIFYEVNCNRENLLKVLADKEGHAVKRWQTLEDLALRHSEDTLSFQVVLNDKGRDEVNVRKAFLEL